MKNLFLHLLLCVALVGCKDDDAKPTDCQIEFTSSPFYSSANDLENPEPPKHPCDYVSASKNDEEWTVAARSYVGFKNDTLYVSGYGNEESLTFKLAFTGVGAYEILPKANDRYLNGKAYYYKTVGGDVIVSSYILVKKATVEIVEYDKIEKVIKGNFEFSFKEISDSSPLSFKQGTFSVHLPD